MSGFEDFMASQAAKPPVTPDALEPQAGALEPPAGFEQFMTQVKGDAEAATTQAAQAIAVSNSQSSAATAAQAAPVAKALGVPLGAVETDLPTYQAQVLAQKNAGILATNPVLAGWVAANPDSARIAQDEFDKIDTMSKVVRTLKNLPAAGLSALPNITGGLYGVAAVPFEVIGQGFETFEGGIANMMGAQGYVPDNAAAQAGRFLRRAAVGQQAMGAAIYTPPADAGVIERGVGSGAQSAVQTLVTLPVALLRGIRDALALLGAVAGGQSYVKAREQGIAPTSAAVYGAADATAEIVTELLPMGKLLGDIKAGTGLAKMLMHNLAREVPGELAATTWQSFNAWATLNPDKPLREWAHELPPQLAETVVATIVGSSGQVGAIKGMQRITERIAASNRGAQVAEAKVSALKGLLEAATDLKLREHDIDGFRTLLQADLEGTAVESLFIPAARVLELYQGARLDPLLLTDRTADPLFGFVPDMPRQLAEAMVSGSGDIVIPAADFIAHMAGSPVVEQLMPDIRIGANELSQREHEADAAEHKEQLKAAIEEAAATKPDSAQRIADEVREAAIAAGYSTAEAGRYASLYAARYATRGARLGIDPYEAYQTAAGGRGLIIQPGEGPGAPGTVLMQTLPGRIPTSKKITPDLNQIGVPDLETLKTNPEQFDKAVAAVMDDPGFAEKGLRLRTTEARAEHAVTRMVDNLLWLHDQVPNAIRKRARLWYDGAQKIAEGWAQKWGKTRAQTAGMLAVLSPQKDWFMNTTMAERVGDILHKHMATVWNAKMDAAAFKFLVADAAKTDPEAAGNTKAFKFAKGKTLAEVVASGDKRATGVWIRAYDEAHHGAAHAVITPEGGFAGTKKTAQGAEARRAWGDFAAIGKAAAIFVDGSPENISANLGAEHKVRNFYNNIWNARDPRFTTIDTHAVAAAQLRPLAGADKAVAANFGNAVGVSSDNSTGVAGTYPLYYEAYKRAAAERGILPREMQSITWEAVRGMFTEGFKNEANKKAVDAIWADFSKGKLTIDEARAQIRELAGGIKHPDWFTEGDAHLNEVLADKTYTPEREPQTGTRVTFEVAPDPRNKELTAKWDALSPQDKADVSHRIAWEIAAKAMSTAFTTDAGKPVVLKGELHQQLGGWMDATNPSLSIWLDANISATKGLELANLLGHALNQEGMMFTSPKKFKGGFESGIVAVDLGRDLTPAQVHEAYALVRGLKDDNGEPIVFGHSTADGHMVILHGDGHAAAEALAKRVDEALGGKYNVTSDTLFAAFPEKGKDYDVPGQEAAGRSGAESSVRKAADQLRSEASRALESALGEHAAGIERSPVGSEHRGRGFEQGPVPGRGEDAGSDRPGAAAQRVSAPEYGVVREGAVSVVGRHYSSAERETLDARYSGTGLKGAERGRLADTTDERLRSRVYFYIDNGKGVSPEAGVGAYGHEVKLNNLYDSATGKITAADANAFESAVLDAGFDGYLVHDFTTSQGAAVLLGPQHSAVPVARVADARGERPAAAAQPWRYALTSKELAKIDLAALQAVAPSAKMRSGTLTVGDTEVSAAQRELVKQGIDAPPVTPGQNDARILYQSTPFYSALTRGIAALPMKSGDAAAWSQALKGLESKGVKREEIAWTGLEEWLKIQPGKIAKEQVAQFLDEGGVKVTETVLGTGGLTTQETVELRELDDLLRRELEGEDGVLDDADRARMDELTARKEPGDTPKYANYQLPGGTNYREVLLTLPTSGKDALRDQIGELSQRLFDLAGERGRGESAVEFEARQAEYAKLHAERGNLMRQHEAAGSKVYQSGHWEQANTIAHIRLNDRTDSEGRKVLFVEELQSDWQAEIRKQEKAIGKAVDADFEGIVARMKKSGELEVNCD